MDPDNDLRADLESAIDSDVSDAGGEPAPSDPVSAPPESTGEPSAPRESADGKVRDSLGRFVPKAQTGQEAPGGAGTLPAAQSTAQAPIASPGAVQAPAQATAAPPSWSPTAREHWASTPAPVQQEIYRREVEMQRFAADTHQARQVAERFQQMIQPHMATIQAEGVDPFTAVGNLMQATTILRMGTVAEKANLLSHLVKTYGVDIGALDSALVGQPVQGQQGPDVSQAVQQALAPLYQAAQARQQRVAQEASSQAMGEMQAFAADPQHEFFGDLRLTMADILEVAQRQGYPVTLAEAYDRAAMLHPEVSKVIMARQQGANARQLTAAAQRARGAAVSVKGAAPVGNPNGHEPTSIRESIEAAIESHSRY